MNIIYIFFVLKNELILTQMYKDFDNFLKFFVISFLKQNGKNLHSDTNFMGPNIPIGSSLAMT